VRRADEARDARDLELGPADPLDPRAHLHEEPGEVGDLRLARRVDDDGRPGVIVAAISTFAVPVTVGP